MVQALQWLDEATQRDPTFVLAYCYAARAHDLLYFYDLDSAPVQVRLAEAAVQAALRLRPDSAEAHLAAADYYFRCHRDYDRARTELEIARPGLPNSTPFFILAGYMSRRQNRWAEGERDFKTAVQLDPRNPNAYNLLSDTYILERRFPEALASYRRVLEAGRATPVLLIRGAQIDFASSGNYKPLREALAKAPTELDIGGGTTPLRVWQALINRDYAEAQRLLVISPREDFQDVDFTFYYPKAWYEAHHRPHQGRSRGCACRLPEGSHDPGEAAGSETRTRAHDCRVGAGRRQPRTKRAGHERGATRGRFDADYKGRV